MDISIDDHWAGFVQEALESGRFSSVGELVDAALTLVQQKEATLRTLRETIQASEAEGGEYSAEDVDLYLEEMAKKLDSEELQQAGA